MRVYLTTLGCRLNEAETEGWASEFLSRGVQIADAPANADLMVLNTCAVTAEASRKSRQIARRLQRQNPGAHLVLSGCHATLYRDEAAALVGVDLVVGNTDKDRLVEMALRECREPSSPTAATEPGERRATAPLTWPACSGSSKPAEPTRASTSPVSLSRITTAA